MIDAGILNRVDVVRCAVTPGLVPEYLVTFDQGAGGLELRVE
jgi:hypothetical protein